VPRIKITQPGWEGFTGDLGVTAFKDGVSVEPVNRRHIAIIGASLSLVSVDEDGVEGENPALQHQMLTNGSMSLPAPTLTALPRATEAEVSKAAPKSADPAAVVFHSKENLETIAEKKGIAGLREIMDPLGVKASSINKAIQVILKEELKLKARLEASGALKREDAQQSETDENDEQGSENDEQGSEGSEGGEQQSGEQQSGSQEPPASRGDAGPGADQTEA
jgi:hypothetical protein